MLGCDCYIPILLDRDLSAPIVFLSGVTFFLAQPTRGPFFGLYGWIEFSHDTRVPGQPPECRLPASAGVCSLLFKD
jgi:hypothetical protein